MKSWRRVETIDADVRASLGARTGEFGIDMNEIGIKDIILPGDIRELVNKVIEAERLAAPI